MSERQQRRFSYDPLIAFMNFYAQDVPQKHTEIDAKPLPVEQRLERCIIDGNATGIESALEEALRARSPLDIMNNILLNGMKTVGELFGAGQMQLPFVLRSAETMKRAVSFLEPYMESGGAPGKGTIVLATVKGDVHDIGKNLTHILLANNGYRVIDLGIQVPVETILHEARKQHADAIGLSGLLVASTRVMKEYVTAMARRGISIPVLLGGAALTRRFVENEIRPVYPGEVFYAQDAFAGLQFMERTTENRSRSVPHTESTVRTDPDSTASLQMPAPAGAALDSSQRLQESQEAKATGTRTIARNRQSKPPYVLRSAVATDVPVPHPPFWGSRVVETIDLDHVFAQINPRTLFSRQWKMKRGHRSMEEYDLFLHSTAHPVLEQWKQRIKEEALFRPAVLYGYFPCQSDGDELVVYRPREFSGNTLQNIWGNTAYSPDKLVEWKRFRFPRQQQDMYLCLSDFFRTEESGEIDVCAFQIVTIGSNAGKYAAEILKRGRYQDYLYLHGLSVETTEALAGYWHNAIRAELGIALSSGQGARYAFGYPACPDLEQHRTLFEILAPQRIGVSMTEEYQLVPEQSTSAVIAHHTEATYFTIR